MILIILAIACLVTVPLTGGSLGRLAALKLRWLWAAPLALLIQVIIMEIIPSSNQTVLGWIHVASYALIVAFLWANRRIVGVPVIAIGTVSNMLVIVANGGVMAASRTAQRIAGLSLGSGFHNSNAVAHPHLLWLGDVIPVPGPLPNVLSVGDCIIFVGTLLLLHRNCRPPATDRTPRAAVHPAPLPDA
ncbi:MAG TPA: DUF5317 domain-containing protein [Solirubrobacteraceae bacterium]|jgi:hypothetical protein|nr:DUF5317 domain-containing protein [Solirubrobacteraceae bacterium]